MSRELPHNLDAEKSIFAAILKRHGSYPDMAAQLNADDFYSPRHRLIFKALASLDARGEPLGPIELEEQLKADSALEKAGGSEYVLSLLDAYVPLTHELPSSVRVVREAALKRRLVSLGHQIQSSGLDAAEDAQDALDAAQQALLELGHQAQVRGYQGTLDALIQVFEDIERRTGNPGAITGLKTGFPDLDKRTAGLKRGQLWILAARPNMGKSALGANIAANVALQTRVPVLFCSLEMTRAELLERMLCSEGRIDCDSLRFGRTSGAVGERLKAAGVKIKAGIADGLLGIDDTYNARLSYLRATVRRWCAELPRETPEDGERPRGLVLVDHLGLINLDYRADGYERTTEVAKALKGLAKESSLPILALCQLSRAPEKRDDKHPKLSDLRESGELEQAADVVLGLYRDDYYAKSEGKRPGEADLELLKQRNGPTGMVYLRFVGRQVRFESLSSRELAEAGSGVRDF